MCYNTKQVIFQNLGVARPAHPWLPLCAILPCIMWCVTRSVTTRSMNSQADRGQGQVIALWMALRDKADDDDRSVSPPIRRPDTTRRGMVYGAWLLLSS
jgi:hypothetical protein